MDALSVGAVLFGGVSAIAAIYSTHVSRRAESNATAANLAAKDANAIARKANEFAAASNDIARAARDDARAAPVDAAWDNLIAALGPFVNLDPTSEPVGPVLTEARVRAQLLVDKLDGWEGLGDWLALEWQTGNAYGREVLEKAQRTAPRTVQGRLDLLEPLNTWAAALTNNLRMFRRVGYDPSTLGKLQIHAGRALHSVHARNGWGAPPTQLPGVVPLEEA